MRAHAQAQAELQQQHAQQQQQLRLQQQMQASGAVSAAAAAGGLASRHSANGLPGSAAASSHNSLAGLADYPSFSAMPSPSHGQQALLQGQGLQQAPPGSAGPLSLSLGALGAGLQRLDSRVFGSGVALDARGGGGGGSALAAAFAGASSPAMLPPGSAAPHS